MDLTSGGLIAMFAAAIGAMWLYVVKLHGRIDELQNERVKDKQAEINRLKDLWEAANERESGSEEARGADQETPPAV